MSTLFHDEITRSAKISECGRYRYALTRTWAPRSGEALFVMLNPSTADGMRDDATIRKLNGFVRRWGLGGFRVANLFAFRATDPRELHRAHSSGIDISGPQNVEHMLAMAHGVSRVVVAWGVHGEPYPSHVESTLGALRKFCAPRQLLCLGVSKQGHPLHPLMLPYSTTLQAFADWTSPE